MDCSSGVQRNWLPYGSSLTKMSEVIISVTKLFENIQSMLPITGCESVLISPGVLESFTGIPRCFNFPTRGCCLQHHASVDKYEDYRRPS